jgi:hypothetical protein
MKLPADVRRDLSDFQRWADGKARFDLVDYAMCIGTPDILFAIFELLEPELVLHKGHYFLAHQFDQSVFEEWAEKLEDMREIQRVMNHVHVSGLVQGQEIGGETAVLIASTIARFWGRSFAHLGLSAEAFGTELDDAQVTLFSHA